MPVTDRDLFTQSQIYRELEPGYRAMTITISQKEAPAQFVQPGSRVDLVKVTKDAKDPSKIEARIFLQGIKVLAVNALYEAPEDGTVIQPTSVTVAVKPEDGEKLFAVSSQGPVGLLLRKPGDFMNIERP